MSLENTLLKTIQEYEKLLQSGKASPEEIVRVHQRMKVLQDKFNFEPERPLLVHSYKIPHLNSRAIRAEHSTSTGHINLYEPDGEIELSYCWDDQDISTISLSALDFFFPRCDEQGEWWHEVEGHLRDYGFNETEYGFMHALKAEGKGSFWSASARALEKKIERAEKRVDSEQEIMLIQEKAARKIKLGLWDTMLRDEAIRELTISRVSLEKGDLTAFFNHIGYPLLDQFYSEK